MQIMLVNEHLLFISECKFISVRFTFMLNLAGTFQREVN